MAGTEIQDVLSRAVRMATDGDAEAIAQLCETSASAVRRRQERGDYLVLDGANDVLAGAIFLTTGPDRARIEPPVVAPEFESSDLPRRLVAVAELMCQAAGCSQVEASLNGY